MRAPYLQVVWACKCFHVGAAVGTLVVLLLLPLSSAMDNGKFNHGVVVEAVAARRQRQRQRSRQYTTIGSKSGRQQER
jgi:hypothetical protein